ncbi:DMT family transporter [Roseivivax sediminis]|uniref:Permease of the drug/metabolite transporter (DMT) superfamily n=1 Tax=Roseivivax sediminis TaxID=936889 RepID=A0A1I2D6M3_9RHOB|nr:DMT family transporter [Roseivivax sediminis]SFE75620.1 Permease of the drug/metabolite transporter (DMT) superfamily [Roseivivax sediminis]
MTTVSPTLHTSETLRACLWMTGAIVSFSSMAVAGRELSVDLDTFEIMLYRSLIGIMIVLAVTQATRTRGEIRARRMGLHTVRNLSHFAGQNFWFYAVATVPLAQVFAVEFTSPIWVMLLSPFVLGERLTRFRVGAGLVGFLGILIVARPAPDSFDPNLLAAAFAAIGFAGSAVFTRRLTRTEHIASILFWLTVMQALFGLLCAGADGDIALPEAAAWPLLAVIGTAGLIAHFCLTTALKLAPATVVMPIDFTRLPLIALVGMALYAEPLDPFVFLGAAVIFAANYANIWRETRPVTKE